MPEYVRERRIRGLQNEGGMQGQISMKTFVVTISSGSSQE